MADPSLFIVGARVLRDKGDELIDDYRANGLSMEMSLNVSAFLKEEEKLREGMAEEGVDAGKIPALMDDLQRIAFIREEFEELFQRMEAMMKGLH